MEFSSALGLASSAGLNAYIPLLAYGLLARYTDFVNLPDGWAWLSDPILLVILGVLLAVEIVADKIPAVDSVNDAIQTLVRPTSGGLMFASAFGVETVGDSSIFAEPKTWGLLAVGFVIALAMHLLKAGSRPIINTSTVGVGAPVASTAEDIVAASLTGAAIFAPVLVVLLLIAVVAPGVWFYTRLRNVRPSPERYAQ